MQLLSEIFTVPTPKFAEIHRDLYLVTRRDFILRRPRYIVRPRLPGFLTLFSLLIPITPGEFWVRDVSSLALLTVSMLVAASTSGLRVVVAKAVALTSALGYTQVYAAARAFVVAPLTAEVARGSLGQRLGRVLRDDGWQPALVRALFRPPCALAAWNVALVLNSPIFELCDDLEHELREGLPLELLLDFFVGLAVGPTVSV